jgi:hypothetical protein
MLYEFLIAAPTPPDSEARQEQRFGAGQIFFGEADKPLKFNETAKGIFGKACGLQG